MKILVISGSRADYGLLYWTIKRISKDPFFKLQICVTGMHLSKEFGLTYKEIEKDGFKIDYKINSLLPSDSGLAISKSIALGIQGFSDAFNNLKPDLILILGDRYEIYSSAITAMCMGIPIAHCHGGETTEGVIDESIRHSITKMAHIHFCSTDIYRKRIIQLGENPNNVFNVGALGVENINRLELLNKKDFEKTIGRSLGGKSAIITFHPVTLDKKPSKKHFSNLLEALDNYKDIFLIFTYSNSDRDGRIIIEMINEYVSKNKLRSISFKSMGQLNYLSALKHVDLVIGNSSSGLIEAPTFKIPTINIGDRQKGRIEAESVISCDCKKDKIIKAIKKGLSKEFRNKIKNVKNPYGIHNSSVKIINRLKRFEKEKILEKKFFNLKFQ